jgi:hypothetical protein
LVLAPIAIPAVAGARKLPAGPLRTALVAWPIAALAVYAFTSQFAYHALQGISIPLGVLAVAGLSRTRPANVRSRRAWPAVTGLAVAGLAVAVAILPGAAYELKTFRDSERSGAAPYWLRADDHDALVYLDHLKVTGGVLAREYIGMAVPAFTGRHTWVGEFTWTPDFSRRAALAEQLMDGRMSAAAAQRFVSATGARFVLADCGAAARLDATLAPLVSSRRRFGCATVYRLRSRALRSHFARVGARSPRRSRTPLSPPT